MTRIRLLSILLALMLLPAAYAGTQDDPEIVDDTGDANPEAGTCNPEPGDLCDTVFDDVPASDAADLIAIWVSESNATHYHINVQTVAAGDADTVIDLGFNVTPTGSSQPDSVAEHRIEVQVTDTTVGDGAPEGTTAARDADDDTILNITFTRAGTDAVGGDQITRIEVTATDEEPQDGAPAPVSRTITTTDSAPDGDASRPYALDRPDIVADVRVFVVSGEVEETIDGDTTTSTFTGNTTTLQGGDATITYRVLGLNAGTDNDVVDFAISDTGGLLAPANITATLSPAQASLGPGDTVDLTLTATLAGTPPGNYRIGVVATSERGGVGNDNARITVPEPVVPDPGTDPDTDPDPGPTDEDDERESAVPGLGFLTPIAEATGADELFGDYAEVVLLALFLLLLILLIFLIVALAGKKRLILNVEPKRLRGRPGETVEFHVELGNRKRRPTYAAAEFEGDPEWKTRLAFGDASLKEQGVRGQLPLSGRKHEGAMRTGRLLVTVPDVADDKETDSVTVTATPLRADGSLRKAQSARVKVQAERPEPAGGLPLRMESVVHAPEHPEAGEAVETTATLENDSDEDTLYVRVVLNVDGHDLQEEPVELPPRSARAVVFTWEVPEGSSKVRVRIYPDA